MDYISGQEGLQIRPALGISNRGKKMTSQGRDFQPRQRDFRSVQGLQISAEQPSILIISLTKDFASLVLPYFVMEIPSTQGSFDVLS